MSPEDINANFEEAFRRIEPKDDAHREKLERLRERLKSSHQHLTEVLEELRQKGEPADNTEKERLKTLAKENSRLVAEGMDAVTDALNEQADLIERIAKKFP